jgi:hypothetical protein
MKKDPDQNSADSAEIEALIIRLERGQLRDGDFQFTRIKLQDSAHERRRVTPTEFSSRFPKLIGNRFAHATSEAGSLRQIGRGGPEVSQPLLRGIGMASLPAALFFNRFSFPRTIVDDYFFFLHRPLRLPEI